MTTQTIDFAQMEVLTSQFEVEVSTADNQFVSYPSITGLNFADKRLTIREILTDSFIDPTTIHRVSVQVLDRTGRLAVMYVFHVSDPRFVEIELDAAKLNSVPVAHTYAVSRCRVVRYRASTASEIAANAAPVTQFAYTMVP